MAEAPSLQAPEVSTPFTESLKRSIPVPLASTNTIANEPAPPSYDNSTDAAKRTASAQPEKRAEASLLDGTTATTSGQIGAPNGVRTDEKHAWKELIDVSREEVQLTLTFFAAPWAAIVLSSRVLNWLWGLAWGAPLIAHPANILLTLVIPPIVFHFAMVFLVLIAEES